MIFRAWAAAHNVASTRLPRNDQVGPDPTVDPNQPITNDDLNALLATHEPNAAAPRDKALLLALARAVYVVPAPPHLISIERPDGQRVVPPGLWIRPTRPTMAGRCRWCSPTSGSSTMR